MPRDISQKRMRESYESHSQMEASTPPAHRDPTVCGNCAGSGVEQYLKGPRDYYQDCGACEGTGIAAHD